MLFFFLFSFFLRDVVVVVEHAVGIFVSWMNTKPVYRHILSRRLKPQVVHVIAAAAVAATHRSIIKFQLFICVCVSVCMCLCDASVASMRISSRSTSNNNNKKLWQIIYYWNHLNLFFQMQTALLAHQIMPTTWECAYCERARVRSFLITSSSIDCIHSSR